MPDNGQNKLLAQLHIGYDEQRKEIHDVNALLSTLGKNVNLDLTEVVEKQVKASLSQLVKEVKEMTKKSSSSISGMGEEFGSVTSQIQDTVKIVKTMSEEGNVLRRVVEGIGADGEKIREVFTLGKDGETVLTRRVEILGEEAALWAEIEDEQKAAIEEEKRLMKELEAEQKRVIKEEIALMKELEAEQAQYIKGIKDREEAEAKALAERNRRQAESDYASLFDEIESGEKAKAEEEKKAVQDLEKAYVSLYRAKAERFSSTEDTSEWGLQTDRIKESEETIAALESALRETGVTEEDISRLKRVAEESDRVAEAKKRLADAEARSRDKEAKDLNDRLEKQKRESIDDLTDAYVQLFNAQAKLAGAKTGTEEWSVYSSQVKAAERAIENLKHKILQLDLPEDVKNDILAVAAGSKKAEEAQERLRIAIAKSNDKLDEQGKEGGKSISVLGQVAKSLIHIMVQFAVDKAKEFFQEAIRYATEFNDKLNEIRIVTGSAEEEARKMGATYRNMAKEMSVSSTEIAEAAVEFWRQGLSEDEVNARLQSTIKYAKISSQEFKEAAELMTAATNGMGVSSQHVADVWSYLGDASAAGGDEIGKAMQKVAATADEAGLSFEWLGAYIATISEKTRQAPEVIGTSLNSIMSRLQSIKQKGYNEEDETQINDIAKALSNIGVVLMDQDGQWRDMSDIFMDIAVQWNDLDDKTRSYIATTLAGTRQKNYFLTLMDDLKNVTSETGEASRAMELYEGALNSAGTAAEKYAIYEESVTAANDRMKASFERLYSLLDPAILKEWYDTWAQVADGLALFLSGGEVTPIIDYTSVIDSLSSEIDTIAPQIKEYEQLYEVKNRTAKQSSRMEEIVITLADEYLPLQKSLKDANGEFKNGAEAIKAMNDELKYALDLKREYEKQNLFKKAMDTSGIQEIIEMREKYQSRQKLTTLFEFFSPQFGYDDLASLTQDQMNALGGEINNAVHDNLALWMKFLYPDKNEREEVIAAWDKFYKDYQGKIAYGYDILRTQTMKEIDAEGNSVLKTSATNIIDSFLAFEAFDSIGYAAKMEAREISQGIADGITEADWEIGQDYVHSLLYNRAREALAMYKLMYEDVQKYGSDENARYNLETEIANFNALFGTGFSFDGIMANLGLGKPPDGPKGGLTDLEQALDALYKKISAGSREFLIAQKSANKWKTELGGIASMLEAGQYEAILNTFASLGSLYSDEYEQMTSDVEWLEHFLNLLSQGKYEAAINVFNTGMQEMQEGMEATDEVAEAFKEKLAGIKESFAIEQAENSNWINQLERLKEFSEMGAGWSGAEWNNQGLISYLKEMEDTGMLDGMMEAFPFLKEFLALYVEELPDGTMVIRNQSEAWTFLDENINRAKDDLLAMLDAYKLANGGITDEEGADALRGLRDAAGKGGWQSFNAEFDGMDTRTQSWLMDNSEAVLEYAESWDEYNKAVKEAGENSEDAKKAQDKMQKSLKKLGREADRLTFEELEDGQKVWDGFSTLIDDTQGKSKEFSKTYGEMIGRVDDLSTAMDALAYIQEGNADNTELLSQAYQDLSSFTGVSEEALRDNLAPALWALQSETDIASSTIANLIGWLASLDGVTIDPSNIGASLAKISSDSLGTASDVADLVMQMLQVAGASVSMGADGVVKVNFPNGNASNYSSRRNIGGGGGGGGGGSSRNSRNNNPSEIEKMLDLMEQIDEIQRHRRDMIDEQISYYEDRGELQGVIRFYEKERDAIEENSRTLEENLARIEEQIRAKQQEIDAMNVTDEGYEQVADDLDALQDKHREYTLQLMRNRNETDALTRSIKEQHDKIREMEIELRELIHQAIEDREARNERMLQGTIDVENEILDIIKARYEAERDAAIEAAEARIEALEEEKELLDEQLEARKKLAEEEDKSARLAQLEAQLARIAADPTRRKEALELQDEINKLRDEMAWELAEEEVEAQKDSIDQQIKSLEEYIEYIQEYYDQMFEHPERLIMEMREIISRTDDEILQFLRENSEEFGNSTDAVQQDMINGWQEMLDDMNGRTRTYWDEVEEIISQGDDAIIEFLREHSEDYRNVGRLQGEAYVDEWRAQLEALRNAHREVVDEITQFDYDTIRKPEDDGDDEGGGGGGGRGGGGGGKKWYVVTPDEQKLSGGYNSETEAAAKRAAERTYWYNSWKGAVASHSPTASSYKATYDKWKSATIAQYLHGGLANFTGPAWLDGSPSAPERVLSPYQTKLFEDMIATLHQINVSSPGMPAGVYDGSSSSSYSSTFGDIIINVDSLSSDADYTEMAQMVMEEITRMMYKTNSVGGIRITR